MKKLVLLFILSLFLISCGSTTPRYGNHNRVNNTNHHHKKVDRTSKIHKAPSRVAKPTTKELFDDDKEDAPYRIKQEIIDYAKTFEGTRYKFGGTTKAGMDCSGLVCVAFQKENIELPRISRDMATQGIPIPLKDVEEGDLVFFKTSSKNVISHVGLVVKAEHGEVRFIHSTTRAGVIISSLDEDYWKKAFVSVRRVI